MVYGIVSPSLLSLPIHALKLIQSSQATARPDCLLRISKCAKKDATRIDGSILARPTRKMVDVDSFFGVRRRRLEKGRR